MPRFVDEKAQQSKRIANRLTAFSFAVVMFLTAIASDLCFHTGVYVLGSLCAVVTLVALIFSIIFTVLGFELGD